MGMYAAKPRLDNLSCRHACCMYAAEPRLDKYYDSVQDSADGVLPEEELEALVRSAQSVC